MRLIFSLMNHRISFLVTCTILVPLLDLKPWQEKPSFLSSLTISSIWLELWLLRHSFWIRPFRGHIWLYLQQLFLHMGPFHRHWELSTEHREFWLFQWHWYQHYLRWPSHDFLGRKWSTMKDFSLVDQEPFLSSSSLVSFRRHLQKIFVFVPFSLSFLFSVFYLSFRLLRYHRSKSTW